MGEKADKTAREGEARQERARRLEESLKKGPRRPQTPHEFVEDQMRKEKQKSGE